MQCQRSLRRQTGFGLIETLFVLAIAMVILIVALRHDDEMLSKKNLMQTRDSAQQVMQALTSYYHENCQHFPPKGTANPTTYVNISTLISNYELSANVQDHFGDGGNDKGFTASIVYHQGQKLSNGSFEPPAYYLVVTADLSGLYNPKGSTPSAGQVQEYTSMLGADYSDGTNAAWVHLPYQNIPHMGQGLDENAAYSRSFTFNETGPAGASVYQCIP